MLFIDNYTKLYSISKTLRFKLIPMFETEDNIEKYGILSNDENRSNEYKKVKKIFDNCHKVFLEQALSEIAIPSPNEMVEVLEKDRQNKTDEFSGYSQKMCTILAKRLITHNLFKKLEPEAIVKSAVKQSEMFYDFSADEIKSLKTFNKFATYFQGYKENRQNIYGVLQGSVAYRIINENFPKFASNIKLFNSLDSEIKKEAAEAMKPLLDKWDLGEIFTAEFFNNVLCQSGIEFYNRLIGGITEDDRTKIQGLNEFLNLKCQQGKINKKLKFTVLFKQILSDREKASFIPKELMTDKDVISEIFAYADALKNIMADTFLEAEEVFCSEDVNTENVYVDKKQIAFLSKIVFENQWYKFDELLSEFKVKDKINMYSISQLEEIAKVNLRAVVWSLFKENYNKMESAFSCIEKLRDCDAIKDFEDIKAYLDSVQECEKTLKVFAANDNMDKDMFFYPIFDLLYGAFRANVSVYNMVRNYATKKPYSTEKYKLNFENPTLANGWDKNKEYENNTMLFIKDGNYYIGILNAKNKPKKNDIEENSSPTDNCYQKMVYKLLPGPNKMLPKVFFSKKGLENYPASESIIDGYEQGKHKKGDNFDLNFCHELIDHFKNSINKHEDWSKFNFEFSDTSKYKDIGEFYSEISAQGYKVKFSYVDASQIESLVKNGKMFLFKLYNKDFSEYSKGRKNLHTLYWNQLFSRENLENPIFKLNGEAELFYRHASIKNPFVHKKGSILISKNDINKQPVPNEVYEKVMHEAESGEDIKVLANRYPNLIFKTAEYDIIKDKRYAKASYAFHVPITINYGCEDKSRDINKMVLSDVSWNKDINIIGIDRGERNLIYVSVINQKGEILKQKSYNIVENSISKVNYHKKLDNLEKARDNARKNWKQISNIKELKEGYLSAVVKEIADMIVEYNAVVTMEDLNVGFKRGRFHIEKQVYQKFEKMLIDKLNYFADKTIDDNKNGSVRYGYQLAAKFKSFRELGKQSGVIFYVPAAYTSKIDPVTGFVNLFTSKQLSYQSMAQSRKFIESFKDISYDEDFESFCFKFDYSNFDVFKKDYTNSWSVYSAGEGRIVHTKVNGYDGYEKIDVTERFIALFEKYNIDWKQENLIQAIISVNEAAFFKEFLWLFKAIVQLRYEDKENDFILSPVQNEGEFFDSRNADENMPKDGDANGAYHIALQGLRIIKKRIKDGKIQSDEKNKQAYAWFEFVQKKEYK